MGVNELSTDIGGFVILTVISALCVTFIILGLYLLNKLFMTFRYFFEFLIYRTKFKEWLNQNKK